MFVNYPETLKQEQIQDADFAIYKCYFSLKTIGLHSSITPTCVSQPCDRKKMNVTGIIFALFAIE